MTVNSAGAGTSTTPRQPHKFGDVPRGIGSPLNRHLSNHEQYSKGDHRSTPEFWALIKKVDDHAKETYDWCSRLKQSQSSCRKQERQVAPKPPGGTPTQSPLQKSGHLQSVVSIMKKQAPQD